MISAVYTLFILILTDYSVQFSHSVMSHSLWPHGCSTPGLPVHRQLPEFTQTHVHWVGDVIQPSHPLSSPSPPALFPSIGVFSNESALCINIGVSASTSVLPMNTKDWSPLGWTGWISLQSKELSRVFSNTTVQKHQFFYLSFLYSPTLTSIHDYWKNHSFDDSTVLDTQLISSSPPVKQRPGP